MNWRISVFFFVLSALILRIASTFASALDLNMGYYHIKLDADAQKLCTIVFLWGRYKYKCLPMGIKIVSDVFQNIMSKLVQDMEYVKNNMLS
jgi:hypothetical protein